ncbi:hypothetical protein F4813DRAFT_281304 [Daldinia decipiens]|uniref:uncharacterized protein n=1 Tax=Daldinia decipiens TaxID=326647 RepID=UPI0020C4B7E9|nr:uncharacterized protein F4813DRAFT_281304 [Daldinia decipiens]KAI1653111.1 hypothetical protein F4813DRAFT_281304 [Daldinia decipiens]
MASYTSKSSRAIVVDNRSSRSSSASSYNTMSSRTSLGAGSTSYPSGYSGTSPVVHEHGRSARADNFIVDITRRSDVTVFNHHGTGYEDNAPSPGYRKPDHRESQKTSGRTTHSGSR